jgi:integrase
MNLTETLDLYVTELNINPNINSDKTISAYKNAIRKFYKENSRVYRMTKLDLKKYLSNIRVKYSDSYYNIIGSALKILFDRVFNQPNKMDWFESIKTKRKFVNIISFNEFKLMMSRTDQIKHKLIIILLYSTGIRMSELLNVKLSDIDYLNKRIFIETLKNGKNRYVQLHSITIKYLKVYFKKWTPEKYLLEGKNGIQYTSSSIQKIINKVSNNKFYPHLFRHTYITNVIEKTDVFSAMELAGHQSLKSTLHYNHIDPDRLNKIYNPLDKIYENNLVLS